MKSKLLPDIGTAERDLLEEEALRIGLNAIHEEDGRIADALYAVYNHFRTKFLNEATNLDFKDALTDARRLEYHVAQCWATDIVNAYTLRQGHRY